MCDSIEIALYGKAYIPAAKDTWRLFKDRGITALINDCLVNKSVKASCQGPREQWLIA